MVNNLYKMFEISLDSFYIDAHTGHYCLGDIRDVEQRYLDGLILVIFMTDWSFINLFNNISCYKLFCHVDKEVFNNSQFALNMENVSHKDQFRMTLYYRKKPMCQIKNVDPENTLEKTTELANSLIRIIKTQYGLKD